MTGEIGFHEGELLVQTRAGVRRAASRLEGMLAPGNLSAGVGAFLAERRLLVLASTDDRGELWVSAVTGSPGFLVAADGRLEVGSLPPSGDPLARLEPGRSIGTIAIDLSARRRIRLNGVLADVSAQGFAVQVEECFGNCPQYIQRRDVTETPTATDAGRRRLATVSDRVSAVVAARIRAADTFFLGTGHPVRGHDCSHRGGPPGFVRVEGNSLWWPDYSGNNMFTSMGNLAVDPTAALLFIDCDRKQMIHLSGAASLEFGEPGRAGDDDGTGRRIRFSVRRSAVVHHPGLRASPVVPYDGNPAVSG